MVSDHYREKYPQPVQWNWPTWQEYQELKRKAAEYDRIMKQPDCEKGDLSVFEKNVEDWLNAPE
jgi:hypothetical protein